MVNLCHMKVVVKELKKDITNVLKKQGFRVNKDGTFALRNTEREMLRNAQLFAKNERLAQNERLIINNLGLIKTYLKDGKKINVKKINPFLIEVKPGSEHEKIFRWWNLAWWSLPYEKAYGRQMRYLVWDKYHDSPIGLIGLQSPILSWKVRDDYLGIDAKNRDYWVNQSLSAQRLGALPPYNQILGGKLVAMLMTTDKIRQDFRRKYSNKKTEMRGRKLPANLLFITTTGAYGKSSVYNRLKLHDEPLTYHIGNSKGSGSFHIPNYLYEKLLLYLEQRGIDTKRGFGSGPSRKLRLIDQSLPLLNFSSGANHGIERAVYLFPFVKNLENVIQKNKRPMWKKRSAEEMIDFWKDRWVLPRTRRLDYKKFEVDRFIKEVIKTTNNATKKYGLK